MNLSIRVLVCLLLVTSSYGQLATKNPLDELKDNVVRVLAEAAAPFTPEQERELALLIEEQRQSSEDLFGQIMDFSGGLPQGQERDRALAGIQWIQDEFLKKLPNYLTPEQRAAWEKYESASAATAAASPARPAARGARTEQIQQIRINNNPFTTEEDSGNGFGGSGPGVSFGGNFAVGGGNFQGGNFQGGGNQGGGGNFQGGGNQGGGGNFQGGGNQGGNRQGNQRTEIIQRGGEGAFHGNFQATFQDEILNARNPFAQNRPPYYERTINGNFNGPLLRERLTINVGFNDNRQENVGTVKVELLDGPFSLGITRPAVSRNFNSTAIMQFSERNSLHFGGRYFTNNRKNQQVGDFSLPSRGLTFDGRNYNFDLRQITILSSRSVYETRFGYQNNHNKATPLATDVGINVLDAFRGGGSQENNEDKAKNYQFGNLFYYVGDRSTARLGVDGSYRRDQSRTEANFIGEFTFSDLESYRNGLPLKYRVTRGNPLLDSSQLQLAFFLQNDFRVTNRFTVSYGARYQYQSNLKDRNNINPRMAAAYAIGTTTVIRAGIGVFNQRLNENLAQNLLRLDGTRQGEILVDNPGWPNPFAAGTLKDVTSRRVRAPELAASYNVNTSLSFERTLPANLFLTVSTDYNRGIRLFRSRNLNAPLPDTGIKPFPNQGHIYQLESTGKSEYRNLRVAMRQRFSVFSVTAAYTLASGNNDSDQPLNLPANNYDLKTQWGPTAFVQKHQFNTSLNSSLPLGVFLTTTLAANSGNRYNITTGKDNNGDGQTNDRPTGILRNSALGPRFFNVSFNFSKAFQIGGVSKSAGRNGPGGAGGAGSQMSIFVNATNALNMTNPGTPSGVMTSPFFGKSFNGSAPREIEMGMRYQF